MAAIKYVAFAGLIVGGGMIAYGADIQWGKAAAWVVGGLYVAVLSLITLVSSDS
jgi:hypothetical protein